MHTKEPWQINRKYSMSVEAVADGQGINLIAECSDPDGIRTAGEDIANARRIVACVNACAGISTDGLESAGVGGLHHIAEATFERRMDCNQIEQQRDELLLAGKSANEALESYNSNSGEVDLARVFEAQHLLRAAIAKVTQS